MNSIGVLTDQQDREKSTKQKEKGKRKKKTRMNKTIVAGANTTNVVERETNVITFLCNKI